MVGDALEARRLLVDGTRLPWSPGQWDGDPSERADALHALIADTL
ncbi:MULTISPECIES: hypothetical protein [unclassified Nocardiopsis]